VKFHVNDFVLISKSKKPRKKQIENDDVKKIIMTVVSRSTNIIKFMISVTKKLNTEITF